MKANRGFTLVEVMVALVVFAVVSVALVRNTTQSLRQAGQIQEKTIAWWLAENRMSALRMLERSDNNFPSVGVSREVIETGDVSWEVETDIESTENDYVRRVVVSVYRESNDVSSVELVGFLGRY
ncbi:MAG: type II secretion system minor pseudopilin GspI [Pseudomonadales bacterium]|nr:type II secretion system minor pseudopilin GspI [Pseudomonadales bacterium]MBO6565821.1 type II secretion system minor pseudopilin GspI [Pseudomonadales bacterium]MBO6595135.1 type II secretion system minor pseudopilin GspI [Pseudomonadales bacterium]MBO6656166.1 type II secretion system minor pseudopilin GspI [Pseudomonadales bacterium]MBO6701640.1 type II secretion system minor pseudopilin GspI [Pseudomonadales bacterium]